MAGWLDYKENQKIWHLRITWSGRGSPEHRQEKTGTTKTWTKRWTRFKKYNIRENGGQQSKQKATK